MKGTTAQDGPVLRLVNGDVADARRAGGFGDTGGREKPARVRLVGDKAPAAASAEPDGGVGGGLEPGDPRWVFAAMVAGMLSASIPGALETEKRARLLRRAELMGLRAFDANLVIAIVQDSARRGEPALGWTTASRVRMVSGARAEPGRSHSVRGAMIAGVLAGSVVLLGLMVGWVVL